MKFKTLAEQRRIVEHLPEGRSRSPDFLALFCVDLLRRELLELGSSRYSIICWRVDERDKDKLARDFILLTEQRDWIFDVFGGL